jgi:hypothetical protein
MKLAASLVYGAEFVTTDPQVMGSIPAATKFSEKH